MEKGKHFYKGEYYSVADLARLSGISISVIYKRLKCGWSIERAVEAPVGNGVQKINGQQEGNKMRIVFHCRIPDVFLHMQPALEKVYVATAGLNNVGSRRGCKQHYIITLDSGLPLIVYPGEFEVIGEVEE